MTDKKSRRVVIRSDTIDQAIFILKSGKDDKAAISKRAESNIVYEAQSIINNYIQRVEHLKGSSVKPQRGSEKKHKAAALLISAAAAVGLIAAFIATGYMMN